MITSGAVRGLERCRLFLAEKNVRASQRAGQSITKHFALLETNPDLGRPHNDLPELRELVIPFGGFGYVALYRHESETDTVYILAFRHQKEAGFH